jgi:hypothetical protein
VDTGFAITIRAIFLPGTARISIEPMLKTGASKGLRFREGFDLEGC